MNAVIRIRKFFPSLGWTNQKNFGLYISDTILENCEFKSQLDLYLINQTIYVHFLPEYYDLVVPSAACFLYYDCNLGKPRTIGT